MSLKVKKVVSDNMASIFKVIVNYLKYLGTCLRFFSARYLVLTCNSNLRCHGGETGEEEVKEEDVKDGEIKVK